VSPCPGRPAEETAGLPGLCGNRLQNILILFANSVEPEAIYSYFKVNFSRLLRAITNVENVEINRIAGAARGGLPYYLIVFLQFDSEDSLQKGLNSAAGQAMASDMSDFATGGVSVLFAQPSIELLGASKPTK